MSTFIIVIIQSTLISIQFNTDRKMLTNWILDMIKNIII